MKNRRTFIIWKLECCGGLFNWERLISLPNFCSYHTTLLYLVRDILKLFFVCFLIWRSATITSWSWTHHMPLLICINLSITIGYHSTGITRRINHLMHQGLKERKWSYTVMLMPIMLGPSRRVICTLDYLYSPTRLLWIVIQNNRTQWNLLSLVWSLFPRRQQWRSSVSSVTSYVWWVLPLRAPLICMGTIFQLFTTHLDMNLTWI